MADPWNTVAESDESNNALSPKLALSVQGQIDLSGQLGQTPTEASPLTQMRVGLILSNTGDAPVIGQVPIRFYASADESLDNDDALLPNVTFSTVTAPTYAGGSADQPAGSDSAPTVAFWPGMSYVLLATVEIPPSLRPGAYHLLAVIDPDNTIDEIDESNNVLASPNTFDMFWRFGTYDGQQNAPLTVPDLNGVPVTYSLKGPGYGEVRPGDNGYDVVFHNTTIRSAGTFATARGRTRPCTTLSCRAARWARCWP